MDQFRTQVPRIPNNQAHLPEDMVVHPHKGGAFVAFSNLTSINLIMLDDEVEKGGDFTKLDEVLVGIYPKEKLDRFLLMNKAG